MNYIFFKLKPFNTQPKWKGNYELRIRKRPRNIHQLLWYIFSAGKFREFYIINKNNNEIICTAETMPHIFIFSFMSKKGIHIGPCFTSPKYRGCGPKYRGCGFYPYIVSLITQHFKQFADGFYIFCSENNKPSLNGINSMGGKEIGRGSKDKYGIYRMNSQNN